MILLHGTTLENAKKMLKNNFDDTGDHSIQSPWYCSDDSMMYFYEPSSIDHNDDATQDERLHRAITMAFENAQIVAACYSNANRIVVFQFSIDDGYVSEDDSCDNMAEMGAKQVSKDHVNLENITNVYFAEFSPRLSIFHLQGLISNTHFRDSILSDFEKDAIEAINKAGIYSDSLLEIDYCEVDPANVAIW